MNVGQKHHRAQCHRQNITNKSRSTKDYKQVLRDKCENEMYCKAYNDQINKNTKWQSFF